MSSLEVSANSFLRALTIYVDTPSSDTKFQLQRRANDFVRAVIEHTKSSRRLSGGRRYALPSFFCFWYSALTSSSHASAARSAAFLAFAGVKSAGAVQVVYFLICLPRTSRSKQTIKRKEITLPFFLFSRMFAIETHPFISDVSMTFTRDFRSCALFCALLEFSRIFALHVLLSKVAKKP